MTSTTNRAKPFNIAAFIALWNNHSIPTQRIADALGISRSAVSWKAHKMGLPSRVKVRTRKADPVILRDMWLAGVASAEIARHFGMSHHSCAVTAAKGLGLPGRKRGPSGKMNGGWLPTITVDQYREIQLGKRMAETARAEQAAIINAHMADRAAHSRKPVGADHARAAV